MKGFTVIDKTTGQYPDCEKIALEEDWAKHLLYCDIDGFAINEDGNLLLMDDCEKVAYCPNDRFEVVEEGEALPLDEKDKWHTGTPTEEGDYLLALCFENLKLDVAHFKDGVFVSYHDHIIASSYIRLWQKIEPYKEID